MTDASNVAVVVTTYNRPAALSWVLASLANQTCMPGQIVIADDGSGPHTEELIESWQAHFLVRHPHVQLSHAWQEDLGFRAAAVRNRAVGHAKRNGQPKVLVFIDGDCVAPSFFIQNHLALLTTGRMVAGGRGLLTPSYTQQLERVAELSSPAELIEQLKSLSSPYQLWSTKSCDRFWSMYQWLNPIFRTLRDVRSVDAGAVRTCNLSLWLSDFDSVGGFDESFVGWGLEDTDLAVRLISAGIKVRSGRFATNVLHLWHQERSRAELQKNTERLAASRQQSAGLSGG